MSIALRRSDEFKKIIRPTVRGASSVMLSADKEEIMPRFLGTHDYKPDVKVAFADRPISEIE